MDSTIPKWTAREDKAMQPYAFYELYHSGVTRGAVWRLDPGLYSALWKKNQLEKIPLKSVCDPVEILFTEHPYVTSRTELKQVDPSLYYSIKRSDLLDDLFPIVHEPWMDATPWNERTNDNAEPLDYYNTHYPDVVAPTLLSVDKPLYEALVEKGNLRDIPQRRTIKDAAQYFLDNYPWIHTRSELVAIDRVLYNRLKKEGLLTALNLQRRHEKSWPEAIPWKERIDRGADPIAYCHTHYPKITRGTLQLVDNALFQYLLAKGREKEIPLDKSRKRGTSLWSGREDRNANPLAFYHEHYEGCTRGRLRKKDSALYSILRRTKMLDNVPLKQPEL